MRSEIRVMSISMSSTTGKHLQDSLALDHRNAGQGQLFTYGRNLIYEPHRRSERLPARQWRPFPMNENTNEFEFQPEPFGGYSKREDFDAFNAELADEEREDEVRRFGAMPEPCTRPRMRRTRRTRAPQRTRSM